MHIGENFSTVIKEENLEGMLSMAFLLKISQTWSLRNKGEKRERGHSFFLTSVGISMRSGKQRHSRATVD